MAEINTPQKDGIDCSYKVAAGEKIERGHAVALNADGFAIQLVAGADIKFVGRCEATVDNTDGDDGDEFVVARRRKAFFWSPKTGVTFAQSDVGQSAYFATSSTVDKVATGDQPIAGEIIAVESDGVWVL